MQKTQKKTRRSQKKPQKKPQKKIKRGILRKTYIQALIGAQGEAMQQNYETDTYEAALLIIDAPMQ